MNPITPKTLKKANEAAIYTLYLYLSHRSRPANYESLRSIAQRLEFAFQNQTPSPWSAEDANRLRILGNALDRHTFLGDSRIGDQAYSREGLTACSFTNSLGEVFVVFRGTGSGEWIDNGEGLSGIPEENTYISYGRGGIETSRKTLSLDHATDQQVEALNWFHKIAATRNWTEDMKIFLCGHSKGGNKAQFITIHSDLVDECFSFDGQGFSPEALIQFRRTYGAEFMARKKKVSSFSTDNDYVNVLGERLMPEAQIYYFESYGGLHSPEAILDEQGRFRQQSEQGKLSRYMEKVSQDLMEIPPFLRQYATRGVMNIVQQYLGDDSRAGSDEVSLEETVVGIGIAITALISAFL